MEMEDQYNLRDLRQLMNATGRPHFPAIQNPNEIFPASHHHRPPLLAHHQQLPYELMMMGGRLPTATHDMRPRGIHEYNSGGDGGGGGCSNNNSVGGATCCLSGGGGGGGGGAKADGGSGRWPRQETLTLLEIRSRLDHKFKEANQKGPLWDEVSRIMCEEHGYQRSGKKCREKFENLYKYYKKTKEGKAGRQDGKHYRFFRQLEALYGETSNNNNINIAASSSLLRPDQSLFLRNNNNNNNNSNDNIFRFQPQPSHHHQDTSVSNSSTFEDSSSSDDNGPCVVAPMDDDAHETKRMKTKKRGWKVKIKDFIDVKMRKMMEKQDEWLHKLMCTMEHKEMDRMLREEEWRKQEACRAEKEQQFWAKERAWIETRDKALMDALHKLTGSSSTTSHEVKTDSLTQEQDQDDAKWPECEIDRLVQLRESMESRFSANQRVGSLGCLDETLWEELALKMSSLGYERTRMACKEKWESLSYRRKLFSTKKRKEDNSRSSASCYFVGNINNESNSSMYNSQGGVFATCDMNNHEGVEEGSPDRGDRNAAVNETFFPFLMGEGDHNMWANYGLKLSKGS